MTSYSMPKEGRYRDHFFGAYGSVMRRSKVNGLELEMAVYKCWFLVDRYASIQNESFNIKIKEDSILDNYVT